MVDFENTIQKMNESTLSNPVSYEKRTYRVDAIVRCCLRYMQDRILLAYQKGVFRGQGYWPRNAHHG